MRNGIKTANSASEEQRAVKTEKPLYGGLVYAVIEKWHEIMRRDVRRDGEKIIPHAEHEQRENAYRGARNGFYTANGTIKCDTEHDKDDGKREATGL